MASKNDWETYTRYKIISICTYYKLLLIIIIALLNSNCYILYHREILIDLQNKEK